MIAMWIPMLLANLIFWAGVLSWGHSLIALAMVGVTVPGLAFTFALARRGMITGYEPTGRSLCLADLYTQCEEDSRHAIYVANPTIKPATGFMVALLDGRRALIIEGADDATESR